MEPTRTTAEAIRSRRLAARLSQRELAQMVGISHTQVARYETQGAEPTLPVAQRLAAALGCSVDELAEGSAVA